MNGNVHLLSVSEAAQQLHVSAPTVRRIVARGDLPAVRVGGSVRIEPDQLRAYLNANPYGPRRDA